MTRGAALAAVAAAAALLPAPSAGARTWYVRAGGAGDGSRAAPFGDPAAVAHASRPGDRIVVQAAPGILTGELRLKPRQELVGRRGARIANPGGDAVRLARRTTVRGLHVVAAGRGGIYGRNVGRVSIRGNEVEGHNASCAPGFLIPPFSVPTTIPGLGVPISAGLQNGWAGIMVDADRGDRRLTIVGNRVHDSGCGDGIDVRASGSAHVQAVIERNRVHDLREGSSLQSVLAIGLQARDASRVVATLDRNRQSGLGNDEDAGIGPGGADSEGVFINPAGHGDMRVAVRRNTYTHAPGRGGFSANGLEFVSMGDGATADVQISDSTFSGTPGDVLEQLALGTNAHLSMTLDRVTATRSTGFAGSGEGNTVLIPGNNGDCLVSASGGAGNVVDLTVRHSALTECANNGLTFGSSVTNGSGPTKALHLHVSDSRITGNRGNNLRVGNVTALEELTVRVERTDLAEAHGELAVTPANASFEDIGTTARSTIDLDGGNCLDGGPLGLALLRYDVSAQDDWWGGPVRALPVGGTLTASRTLAARPPYC